jgi:hypothetical protein
MLPIYGYMRRKVSSCTCIAVFGADLGLTDVPNPQELLLQTKLDSINRFLGIIRPLKRVYKLPDASLHIFYDLAGPLIAFNSNGALFLNLRYYEGWRQYHIPTFMISCD